MFRRMNRRSRNVRMSYQNAARSNLRPRWNQVSESPAFTSTRMVVPMPDRRTGEGCSNVGSSKEASARLSRMKPLGSD